jgi:hypothetical protein
MCIIILVSTMGCFNDALIDDGNHGHMVTILFSNPEISFIDDNKSLFDAQVTVLKITPREGKIRWDDVTFKVWDFQMNIIQSNVSITPLRQRSGEDFIIHYSDAVIEDGFITRNETLLFSNMDERYAGTRLGLIKDGNQKGSLIIPFMEVELTYNSIEERINEGASWYSINYTFTHVFCPGSVIKWDDCHVKKWQLNGRPEFIPLESYPIKYGSGIEAWYLDVEGQTDIVDEGDILTITRLSIAYQDGYVRFLHGQDVIGTKQLPSNFS